MYRRTRERNHEKEIPDSLCCDGFISAVSRGVFGCSPITSFSRDVGLIARTRVVNRFTIMFDAIIVSGITMIADCGFGERNMLIVATNFCIGIGTTEVPAFFAYMPQVVRDIFQNNMVAWVFVVAMLLSLLLSKDMDRKETVSA